MSDGGFGIDGGFCIDGGAGVDGCAGVLMNLSCGVETSANMSNIIKFTSRPLAIMIGDLHRRHVIWTKQSQMIRQD